MKSKIRIAVCQIDIQSLAANANLKRMLELIEESAGQSADLVVFPELSNIGYIIDRDREFGERYVLAAETIPGPSSKALCDAAARHRLHIIVGLCESHPVIPATLYNTAVLIGPDGNVRGLHRKMHIPGQEKHYFASGTRAEVFHTELGTIGINICYDAFFPELARTMALKGAHLIVCPFNTGTLYDHPDTLRAFAQARAIENKLFFVTCNRTGSWNGQSFNGRSAASDPYGNVLMQAEDRDGMALVDIDYSLLIRERAFHPIFADRHPRLYRQLTEELSNAINQ